MFRFFPMLGAFFLAIPLIEIALFVVVGGEIGLLATIAIVIATGILGAGLVSWQGLKVFETAQRDLANDQLPVQGVVEGLLLLAAALMLITPGFATDTLGFLLAVPFTREAAARFIRKNMMTVVVRSTGAGAPGHGPRDGPTPVIDGEIISSDRRGGPHGS
ncbi:FxsA family protein [Tepidamorphus sp. 3E244]|uniref:FxsA family protein n=1 Tax=Tepidamorphus sp. 3E244 TaxID=3385498 RepID=UPI0038FCB6F9